MPGRFYSTANIKFMFRFCFFLTSVFLCLLSLVFSISSSLLSLTHHFLFTSALNLKRETKKSAACLRNSGKRLAIVFMQLYFSLDRVYISRYLEQRAVFNTCLGAHKHEIFCLKESNFSDTARSKPPQCCHTPCRCRL